MEAFKEFPAIFPSHRYYSRYPFRGRKNPNSIICSFSHTNKNKDNGFEERLYFNLIFTWPTIRILVNAQYGKKKQEK